MEWSFVIGSGVLATLMAYQISVAYDEPFPKLEQRTVQMQGQVGEQHREGVQRLKPAGEMIQIIEQTQKHTQTSDPICGDEDVSIQVGSRHQTEHRTMSGNSVTDPGAGAGSERRKTV